MGDPIQTGYNYIKLDDDPHKRGKNIQISHAANFKCKLFLSAISYDVFCVAVFHGRFW